ncbi:MAG: hypothetical protein K5829_11245 [Treponema sp.]|nr:hypothetical protein [Treponema sp.]
MKKNSLLSLAFIIFLSSFLCTSCIYDEPASEVRPSSEPTSITSEEIRPIPGLVLVTTAGGVNAVISEDRTTATALLSQGKDSGIVLYLYDDKSQVYENATVSYEFSYKVKDWSNSALNPKFLIRYGDSTSSWSGYDPSYSNKTNYEDARSNSGTVSSKIILKNKADAIVFATNGYNWAGDASDTVEVTIKKVSVFE